MKQRKQTRSTNTQFNWLRLGLPVGLALLFMMMAMALPIAFDGAQPLLPARSALPAFDIPLVQAANGVTITKYATPTIVAPGGSITYTLVISNDSADDITGVTVTDDLPENTTCQNIHAPAGWLVSNCDATSTGVAWLLLEPNPFFGDVITAGNTVSLTYVVKVTSPLPNNTEIVNAADSYNIEVISPTASHYDDSGSATVTTTVKAPAWQISKTVSPSSTVEPGDGLLYTLTISNTGENFTGGQYTITDTVPVNTNFVNASNSGTESGGLVTWQLTKPLTAGHAFTLTFRTTVARPLTNTTVITNDSYGVSGGGVYTPASGSPVTITVKSPVTMTISKADSPDPVQAGSQLVYTLTVTTDSSSKGPAENVVVTDTVPVNTVFVDAGIQGGGASIISPTVGSRGVITWTITNPLPVGDSVDLTMLVRVESPLTNGMLITNTAYGVTSTNAVSPTSGKAVETTVQSSPNITFSKTVQPQGVGTRQPVTYTIVITNSGNETAHNLPFTDSVQAPDFDLSTPTWTIPVVTGTNLAGTPGVVTYTLVATSGTTPGQYPNYLTTTVKGTDISVGPVATVTVAGQADLQISKQAVVSFALAGAPITYTITITNAPGSDAAPVVITDTVTGDSGISVSSATASKGSCNSTLPIVCNISSFTKTETITVVLSTSAGYSNTVTNTAFITSTIPGMTENNAADNSAGPVTVTVRPPLADLEISKTVNVNEILAGNAISYTLTITNHGPQSAGFVVTDTFEGGSYYACNPGCSIGMGYVTWPNLPNLGSGLSTTVMITLTTASNYSGLLTNTAVVTFNTASSSIIDPGPNPNTDQVILPVRPPSADLEISKTAGKAQVFAGDPLTYTIAITNNGSDTVGVAITDTFTPASGAVSGKTCSDSCSWSNNTATWSSLTLTGGQTRTLILTLTTNTTYSGTLTNTTGITFSAAYAHAVDPGPNPNTDQTTTPVYQLAADLELEKTTAPSVPSLIQPGDPITYVLTIINNGPDTVTAIVTDTFSNAAYDDIDSNYSGYNCTNSVVGTGGRIICTLPNFAPGSTTITVTLDTANSDYSSDVINYAIVDATSFVIDTPGNNDDGANIGFDAAPVLDIAKNASPASGNSVQPGDTIIYSLSVTNKSSATAPATNVVLTDTLPSGVGLVSVARTPGSSYTPSGNNHTFSITSLDIGKTLTATLKVTVTAETSGTVITNNAGAYSSLGSIGTASTNHTVYTATATAVYLPIIIKNYVSLPNLTTSISVNNAVNPPVVTVIVTNNGNTAVSEPFWVDLYVDPSTPPNNLTGRDRRWQQVSTVGMAWPVTTALASNGGSVTLTTNSGFDSDQTNWVALSAGTHNFYTFADSYDNDDPQGDIYVEVPESNETDNHSSRTGISISGAGFDLSLQQADREYPPR
jgi:uncharacterized repeat protein (TIGR01451 family)